VKDVLNTLGHLGREIHRRYDEFGPLLVFDDGNKRFLSFGTADEQSCQLKKNPLILQHDYARCMFGVLTRYDDITAIRNITLLGTGGGTLATVLHERLSEAQIAAVDVRAAVFQVARQYFGLPRSPRLQTFTMDASHYLATATAAQCDLLITDLYQAEGLDPLVLQPDFLKMCAMHLQQDGWLVLNLWKEHREQTDCLQHLKVLFPTIAMNTTSDGNWIIWASRAQQNAADRTGRDEAKRRCKQLNELLEFNLWQQVKGFYRGS